jgi:hypothetical protein
MRMRDKHAAVESLRGEPVSRSSIKNWLASNAAGMPRLFARVGRGRYRLSR